MLFYVKIQLLMDRMNEMLKKSSDGEIPNPAQYSTIYCSAETPGLGYSIFDVESRETLDEILRKLGPFSKVYEAAPVMTLAEFQRKIQG
jgi:hypothetical protein